MNENGNGRRFITRDFKFASARKTIEVDCRPELEATIRLRALAVGQMKQLQSDSTSTLALMIVDEEGRQLYTTEEDLQNLAEMPLSLANRLMEQAAELNGISKAAMETARKNSQASTSGASVSA
jgi:hypothetical protein